MPVQAAYAAAIDRWNRSPHGDRFPEWDRPVRRRQLQHLLAATRDDDLIVDVGTGSGIVASTLVESARRVVTVDVPGGNEQVAAWLRAHGAETATVTVGPERIPAADGAASAVLLADVIEHLPGSPLPLLAELARVLRPQGLLVLTTPNATRLHVRLKLLRGRSNWPPLSVVYGDHAVHPSHHREYTATELREVAGRASFVDCTIEHIEERLAHKWDGVAGRMVSRALETLAPSLCGDLVLTARR